MPSVPDVAAPVPALAEGVEALHMSDHRSDLGTSDSEDSYDSEWEEEAMAAGAVDEADWEMARGGTWRV